MSERVDRLIDIAGRLLPGEQKEFIERLNAGAVSMIEDPLEDFDGEINDFLVSDVISRFSDVLYGDDRRRALAGILDDMDAEEIGFLSVELEKHKQNDPVDFVFNALIALDDEDQLALIGQIAYMDDGFWRVDGEPIEPMNRLRDAIIFANESWSVPDEDASQPLADEPFTHQEVIAAPGPPEGLPTQVGQEVTTPHVLDGWINYKLMAWRCFEITVAVDGPRLRELIESVVLEGQLGGRFTYDVFDVPVDQRQGELRREVLLEYFKLPEDVQPAAYTTAMQYEITAAAANYRASHSELPPLELDALNELALFFVDILVRRLPSLLLKTDQAARHRFFYGNILTVKKRDVLERVFLPGFVGGYSGQGLGGADDRLIEYAPLVDEFTKLWAVGVRSKAQGEPGKMEIRNMFSAYYHATYGDDDEYDLFMRYVEQFIGYIYKDHKRSEYTTPKNIAYLHAHLWLFRKQTSISRGKPKYKKSQRLGGISVIESSEIN